ncbi:Transglutaminase-activating metalloprotease precursor [Streptomyces sp. YIM 130001]|uniref:M4 family metallopeptidase n=1 Tax=Streptomyces sp. YIM 130001 TaxID=2259644 RepID=UPI000E65A1C8|nr:M4 family metallopeptidase [Streptomyces sp. YIM 130001]RII15683.1 Transglutaminase-activating metalloprotease precursor [Streptomyces sp. YIM 130001]
MSPHISRPVATLSTAVAAAALLAAGLSTGATAQPSAEPTPSSAPSALSASQRAELLRDAASSRAETAEKLGLGSQEKLVVRDVIKDRDGSTHTRYERTYASLPVLGGDLVVHASKAGKYESATRAVSKKLKVNTTGAAKAPKDARKVIWAAQGTPKLAYEQVKKSTKKDGTPSELHIVTDARTGDKLFQWDAVHNGAGHTTYTGDVELSTAEEGGAFTLTDNDRGGHKTFNLDGGSSGGTLFSGDDDEWGDGTPDNAETAGADAHYGAALTWDYYKNVHGREGIKGDGKAATSNVHYGDNYVNAFWQDSCFCMTYGDGEGNAKPLTSIDVSAHEMTHGVTSNTAGLVYSGESGGLNEATSDIFGTAVEFNAANEKDVGDYLIGEMIDINGDGSPLRHMDQPSKDGSSEDYWYDGIGDVDVHYSSGVANHFFYLLSEGSGAKEINGVSYDSPTKNGEAVTGIGRDKAEQIWFKALTTYMTSNTDYAAARQATLDAAKDLYGADSEEVKATDSAWAGVDVK